MRKKNIGHGHFTRGGYPIYVVPEHYSKWQASFCSFSPWRLPVKWQPVQQFRYGYIPPVPLSRPPHTPNIKTGRKKKTEYRSNKHFYSHKFFWGTLHSHPSPTFFFCLLSSLTKFFINFLFLLHFWTYENFEMPSSSFATATLLPSSPLSLVASEINF